MGEQPWIVFNHLTQTYDTRDGTKVAAELVENQQCLADVLYVSSIRQEQRNAMRAAAEIGRKAEGESNG